MSNNSRNDQVSSSKLFIWDRKAGRLVGQGATAQALYGFMDRERDIVTVISDEPRAGLKLVARVSTGEIFEGTPTILISKRRLTAFSREGDQLREYEVEIFGERELFERHQGILDGRKLALKSAVHVGGGTVGATVFDQLLKAGVENHVLIDPSNFRPQNISRHLLDLRYLGWPKVKSLEAVAYYRNPSVNINAVQADFTKLSFIKRRELLADADLIISSTDSNDCEFEAAFTALELGIPFIHIGLHERAKSGELCFQIPGYTQCCLNCWLGFRKSLPQQEGEALAYSDIPIDMIGRTIAEPALSVEIGTIVGIAMQWVLAILMGPGSDRWKNLLDAERNLVLINGSGINEPLFSEPFQIVRPYLNQELCELCRSNHEPQQGKE